MAALGPTATARLSSPMASIGVPAEIKRDEQRVALTPDGARELVSQGMEVRIETGAGLGAGITDDAYAAVGARLVSLVSSHGLIERLVPGADLVIGAVLLPGGRAPTLVEADLVRQMKPGSVIVDVAIDQGGCIATSRETTHTAPTFEVHGVLHYAVGNMPGAVPFTSTEALVSVTLPYILVMAGRGLSEAVTDRPELLSGLNTVAGSVCHPGVAKALGLPSRHPMACLR